MPTTTETKSETYGLDHDSLMATHRKHTHGWKWATERKIKEEYGIPSGMLHEFHNTYELPRLKSAGNRALLYSLPALETILETVPEFLD